MKFFVTAENKAEDLQPALQHTTVVRKKNFLVTTGKFISTKAKHFHLCNSWLSQQTKQHFKALYCAIDRKVQPVKYVYIIHISN
jgi:hypothetical protein